MEAKKISFGFSKIKKPNLAGPSAIGSQKSKDGDKVELISCLEGQAIKIVGKENDEAGPPPLVIPLREQDKTTIPDRLAKLQDIIEGREGDQNGVNKDVEVKPVPVGNESLEQRAAREILEDLQERKSRASEKDSMVVPLKPEDLPLDGGRESTMDDYESVPIEKFGLAMLRGMGWKEDPNAPKKSDKFPEGPVQRPKGMGLGAERAPKDKSRQLIPPAKDEVLVMKKGAFVKVLAGKHKETYGTVESLDEENARVVVRFSIGGGQESLNEYLLQLVSNAEYKKYSKVLNNAKYEEFKNRTTDTKTAIKEEKSSADHKIIKRDPSASPSPPRPSSSAKSQPSRSHRDDYDRRERSPDTRAEDRRQYRQDRHDRNDQSRRDRRSPAREDRRRQDDRQRRRPTSSSSSDDASDSDESNDRDRDRHHHHRHKSSSSTSSYARTSSGTKKKSHKYKQRRDHSRERDRDRGHSSDEDDRHHKKKTKKSKKQRSRSRSRR